MAAYTPVRLTIFGTICFMTAFFMAIRLYNDGKPGWKHIVTSDGRGYYAYLPALFLDRDLTFVTTVQREAGRLGDARYKPGYMVKYSNTAVNKYFAGEALLLMPFFLTGWLLSVLTGLPVDGYSFFFQVFTGLGALFYLAWGLLFLERILNRLSVPGWAAAIAILIITTGTNLFYYSLWQPTMSHVYSFFAINGFLWHSMRVVEHPGRRNAILTGIFFGILCLTRPTNGIVLLAVPFLVSHEGWPWQNIRSILTRPATMIPLLSAFIAVVAIQPILWYQQTGNLFIWSYQGEGFRLLSPEITNTLFSYRKGLFIYTPVLLLAITGLFATALDRVWRFVVLLLFFLAAVWIIASWWNWYYGDGFGLRAFIDYYGIFAILIALGIRKLPSLLQLMVWFTAFVFIAINMIQTWQYTHGVLHPNSMNATKFHHVFLRCDSATVGSIGGNTEMAAFDIRLDTPAAEFFNAFGGEKPYWSPVPAVATPVAFSGAHCTVMDSLHPFGKGIEFMNPSFFSRHSRLFIEGTLIVRDSTEGASNTVLIVLSMDDARPGENYWQGFRINDVPNPPSRIWRPICFSLMLPEISNPKGTLKVYTWQTGKGTVWVDDFGVKLYSGKE